MEFIDGAKVTDVKAIRQLDLKPNDVSTLVSIQNFQIFISLLHRYCSIVFLAILVHLIYAVIIVNLVNVSDRRLAGALGQSSICRDDFSTWICTL